MRIIILCATKRGYTFLRRLHDLEPSVDLVVFSFREEPSEPPFLDDIRRFTLDIGGQFYEARNLGDQHLREFWDTVDAQLMLCVSWRYIVPASVYHRPNLGSYVFHDSLLPKYRGFSPTVWAIINGEDHTGVTLFEMSEEFDKGPIIDQKRVDIGHQETIGPVMERVTEAYIELLERNLSKLLRADAPRYAQDEVEATYACKRQPDDNRIDWAASTDNIFNLIRAVSTPYPGAYTYLDGEKIRIWAALKPTYVRYVGRVAGRVVEVRPGEGIVVLTGDNALLVTEVQTEKGPCICAADIVNRVGLTLT